MRIHREFGTAHIRHGSITQFRSREYEDLELKLRQVQGMQMKSERMYKKAQAEIESSQKLSIELKNMIFEKMRREGRLLRD